MKILIARTWPFTSIQNPRMLLVDPWSDLRGRKATEWMVLGPQTAECLVQSIHGKKILSVFTFFYDFLYSCLHSSLVYGIEIETKYQSLAKYYKVIVKIKSIPSIIFIGLNVTSKILQIIFKTISMLL